MKHTRIYNWFALIAILLSCGCSSNGSPSPRLLSNLKDLVGSVQHAVVTVINYNVDGEISSIGSGFFISPTGVLLTNLHVLEGAYHAEIKTHDGSRYPVATVLAKSQVVDLIKVRVDIPANRTTPAVLSRETPAIADRIFVVGSPMGLDQTVSEGIISAVREIPGGGNVLQLTAPISRGSSGGPVLNRKGEVVGVVTFQAAKGQNLNFAISINALDMLSAEAPELSIAEWTIKNSSHGPALAAALCSKGSELTIQGEYKEALTYFKKAADTNPEDPDTWYGLGSCYMGIDQPENAIAAFRRPIEQDPDNAVAHFILAMHYKAIGRLDEGIVSLTEVIRIDPSNLRAQFELGRAYGAAGRTTEQIETFTDILADRPDHIPTLLNLGMVFGAMGHLDEAMALFSRARKLEPDNELIHFNMGVILNLMNRPEASVRAYTHAIRANPRMVRAHYNLGLTYLEMDRRKQALDQYEILKHLDAEAAGTLFDRIYPENGE
jgi:tetratricopeptide (TPR) repeat protein